MISKIPKYLVGAFYVCVTSVVGGVALSLLPIVLILSESLRFCIPTMPDTLYKKLDPFGRLLETLVSRAQQAFAA